MRSVPSGPCATFSTRSRASVTLNSCWVMPRLWLIVDDVSAASEALHGLESEVAPIASVSRMPSALAVASVKSHSTPLT